VEPTFEQKKISWLETLLSNWVLEQFDRQRPDWVPTRVRLTEDLSVWTAHNKPFRLKCAGEEIDCQSTVFGFPAVTLDSGLSTRLDWGSYEVLAFGPNLKKQADAARAAAEAESAS